MDASLLVWTLRIRETEVLLKGRQKEREAQATRRAALQEDVQDREIDKVRAGQRVCRAQEQLSRALCGASAHRLTLQQVQVKADDGQRLSSLRATQRSLAARVTHVAATAASEASRCESFSSQMETHECAVEQPAQKLQADLRQATQRLEHARKTYDMGALTTVLDEQRRRREDLMEEVRRKRTELEAASQQVDELRGQMAERERANVEAVEASQSTLREVRAGLASQQDRLTSAQQRLSAARSQRMAAAGRLAELQRSTDAARQTVACLLGAANTTTLKTPTTVAGGDVPMHPPTVVPAARPQQQL